jgi:hypothetical protein
MNTEDIQYIYLLQTREFINSNLPVYKVGKTKQINNLRFISYPKGSILMGQLRCKDCNACEKQILTLFDNKYKNRQDLGREYYEGEYRSMILDIMDVINYRKEIEDLKETQYLQRIEKLEKENAQLKKEKTGFIDQKNDLKNEISKIMVDSLVTGIAEKKEPENIIEKREKINKLTKKQYKFSCEKCFYYTDSKFCLENHKKSKTHEKREKDEFVGLFECKICKKVYKSNSGFYSHKKTCQLEKENETKEEKEKEKISSLLKEILLEIKEQ